MANFLTSLFPSFANRSTNQAVTKAKTKPLAVGVVPGSASSLQDAVTGQPHDANYELLYDIYDINTDVSGSIDRWIGVVAGDGWDVELVDKSQPVTPELQEQIDAIKKWLRNPNPARRLKFDRLIAETIVDLGVSGDAFWAVVRSSKGLPQEISIVHPSTMRVVADEYGVVLGYVQTLNGRVAARFKPHEIIHFRLPSRKNDLYGQSPLERALAELEQDLKALSANKSLLDNGMSPAAVLMISDDVTDPTLIQNLQEQVNQRHSGTSKWHRLLALAGVKDLKPWGHSLKDMQFSELRALATSKIATVYGVAKLYLNQKDAADYATSEVLERDLYNNKGKMLRNLLSELITEDLIHGFSDQLRFVFKPPQFGNPDALRKDAIEAHKTNPEAITTDDLRETYFGLARQETPVAPSANGSAAATPEVAPDDEDATDPEARNVPEPDETAKRVTKAQSTDEIDPLAAERDREMIELSEPLVTPISDYFDQQEADYLANLDAQLDEEGLDDYLSTNQDAFDSSLSFLLAALLFPALSAGVHSSRQQMLDQPSDTAVQTRITDALPLSRTNQIVQGYARTQAFKQVTGINATTREQLRAALMAGLREGEGVDQLSERIAGVFNRARDYRSDLIARNETARAYAYANYETLSALYADGIVAYRQWMTSPEDGRVCEICLPLNGITIPFEDQYPDGLEPGNAHIQCRCTEIGLLAEEVA